MKKNEIIEFIKNNVKSDKVYKFIINNIAYILSNNKEYELATDGRSINICSRIECGSYFNINISTDNNGNTDLLIERRNYRKSLLVSNKSCLDIESVFNSYVIDSTGRMLYKSNYEDFDNQIEINELSESLDKELLDIFIQTAPTYEHGRMTSNPQVSNCTTTKIWERTKHNNVFKEINFEHDRSYERIGIVSDDNQINMGLINCFDNTFYDDRGVRYFLSEDEVTTRLQKMYDDSTLDGEFSILDFMDMFSTNFNRKSRNKIKVNVYARRI